MAKIKIKIRIVHLGQEVNLTIDTKVSGNQIIKALLNNPKLKLNKIDEEGTPVLYKLKSKKTNQHIEKQTLEESNVADGDLLVLVYEIIAKPIIYLYPKQEQNISVKLDIKAKLTITYPPYNNEWKVKAFPNGKIINLADNKEYSYLFWEADYSNNWKIENLNGFVVKGEDTAVFLQNILSEIGLLPKEYNEFIVWWLPKMKNNRYNFIHFSGKEYQEIAKLIINPKPDSILRVFMVWKVLENKIEVVEQKIENFERKGFSVVEWGGTEI